MTELFEQQRFNAEANRVYQMPVGFFDAMRNNPTQLFATAYKFARHHVDNQVPRLKGLMDYYVAKNQIKQWPGSLILRTRIIGLHRRLPGTSRISVLGISLVTTSNSRWLPRKIRIRQLLLR